MSILKLEPSCKDYLWGGSRLIKEYGKAFDGDVLAETWELSCHPDGPSVICNGEYAGRTLQEYIGAEGKKALGVHCRRFKDFPILVKFIDAKDNLSIQVHPDNRYALKQEGQYGKTEMWYVMDAGKDAFLYYGFRKEISKEEFAKRIQEDTLLEALNAVPVQKGDVLFIEAGTIHAIGKDILIAEIQQNSNVTYRVYDYGRVGKDGKKRDLHIEKALAVTNRIPIAKDSSSYPHVADCDYFTVDKLNLDGKVMKKLAGNVQEESFASILILDGEGTISNEGETLTYKKGDSFFLPAGSGDFTMEGVCDALITTIREQAAQVRIGIEIGSIDTRVGLIGMNQQLIAGRKMKTNAMRPAEEVIQEISQKALELLEQQQIPVDQCIGVGIGVPGTVDRKRGIVRYSNNIRWENVDIGKEVGKYLPIPIYIANNADCAALGEVAAGAGRGCQDVIMVTLGTGVGGGIILDGSIYEGKGIGGSELGHMVIVEYGEPCTCGRRGCLEAYASVDALIREAQRAAGEQGEFQKAGQTVEKKPFAECRGGRREAILEEIAAKAEEKDEGICRALELYTQRLGTGIVNIVNIFRPQLILIGGEIAPLADILTESLSKMVKENCFGREKGELPEIKAAELGGHAGVYGAASLI